MAWMRPCGHFCTMCGKKATCEVLNNRNASHGYFCISCGNKEVARLNAEEVAAKKATE